MPPCATGLERSRKAITAYHDANDKQCDDNRHGGRQAAFGAVEFLGDGNMPGIVLRLRRSRIISHKSPPMMIQERTYFLGCHPERRAQRGVEGPL